MTDAKKPAKPSKRPAGRETSSGVWTAEEKSAMKEHARAMKAAAAGEDAKKELLAKIAEMPEADKVMAKRIHAVITTNAPGLQPGTWYGMPSYSKDGKVICFFQPAAKFKARYATFGFNDAAMIDDGAMWATSWALTKLTDADEAKIAALVKKAAR